MLDAVLSAGNLGIAWRLIAKDRAPWTAAVSRQAMDRNCLFHQLELVEQVRKGTYHPQGMRQFTIQKADGNSRVISAPFLRDKFIQRAVVQVLSAVLDPHFHHDSFGYRPGRGVVQALQRCEERIRCGFTWLVDTDISACFDHVPHRPLLKRLRRAVEDDGIENLVRLWLNCGTYSAGILTQRCGIPQGAVMSPLLCNLYLDQLDRCLATEGVPFVRYADDFMLFLRDRRTADRALTFTRRELARLGLSLNPAKTRIIHAGAGVRFLGAPLRVPNRLGAREKRETCQ
jgi:RNA-directed DNA polymerase